MSGGCVPGRRPLWFHPGREICLSIHPSIHATIHLSIQNKQLINSSIHLFIHPSVYLSIRHPSVHLLFFWEGWGTHLDAPILFIQHLRDAYSAEGHCSPIPEGWSIYSSIHLSIHPLIHPSTLLIMHPPIYPFIISPFIYSSIQLFIHLSIHHSLEDQELTRMLVLSVQEETCLVEGYCSPIPERGSIHPLIFIRWYATL